MPSKRPTLSLVVNADRAAADADIDRLYQLPLGEFTAARNELAKRRPNSDPPVKSLPKPTVAAWAVNQLYWHDRPLYDQLIESSEQLRAEHRRVLAGKTAALREAEHAHRALVRAAADAVRTFLARGGEAATPATLASAIETLEALPTPDPPGRLARPLKPMGFEALAGVTVKRSSGAARPAAAAPSPSGTASRAPAAEQEAKQEEARRRQAVKDAERTQAAADRARVTLDQAERALDRARRVLEAAERDVADAKAASDRARAALKAALAAHQHAQRLVRE